VKLMAYLRFVFGMEPRHPVKEAAEDSRRELDKQIQETRAGAASLVHQVRREREQVDRVTIIARQALHDLRTVERQN
jgi:hypothetical protein